MLSNTVKMLHIGFRHCKPFSSLKSNQLWTFLIRIKLTVKIENEQALLSRLKGDINRNQTPIVTVFQCLPSWAGSSLTAVVVAPVVPGALGAVATAAPLPPASSELHGKTRRDTVTAACSDPQGFDPLPTNRKPAQKGGAPQKCSELCPQTP